MSEYSNPNSPNSANSPGNSDELPGSDEYPDSPTDAGHVEDQIGVDVDTGEATDTPGAQALVATGSGTRKRKRSTPESDHENNDEESDGQDGDGEFVDDQVQNPVRMVRLDVPRDLEEHIAFGRRIMEEVEQRDANQQLIYHAGNPHPILSLLYIPWEIPPFEPAEDEDGNPILPPWDPVSGERRLRHIPWLPAVINEQAEGWLLALYNLLGADIGDIADRVPWNGPYPKIEARGHEAWTTLGRRIRRSIDLFHQKRGGLIRAPIRGDSAVRVIEKKKGEAVKGPIGLTKKANEVLKRMTDLNLRLNTCWPIDVVTGTIAAPRATTDARYRIYADQHRPIFVDWLERLRLNRSLERGFNIAPITEEEFERDHPNLFRAWHAARQPPGQSSQTRRPKRHRVDRGAPTSARPKNDHEHRPQCTGLCPIHCPQQRPPHPPGNNIDGDLLDPNGSYRQAYLRNQQMEPQLLPGANVNTPNVFDAYTWRRMWLTNGQLQDDWNNMQQYAVPENNPYLAQQFGRPRHR